MIGVLITGCSMHSYDLIRVLRNNHDGEAIHVVGINCDENALLRKGVDAGYVVPRITEPDYLPTVLDICQKEKVNVIMPYITAELPIMAENRAFFEERGIRVSVSSPESLMKAGNKVTLSERFAGVMPKQAIVRSVEDCLRFAATVGYPDKKICCKLTDKCGGVGFCVVDETLALDMTLFNKFGQNRFITLAMLLQLVSATDETVILQEYEEGHDYSMCGLADNGKLLYALGFEAMVSAFGSAMAAKINQNPEALRITEDVVAETGLDGNFCCDFILKEDGDVKLLEINPRLTATLPFIAEAGLNLPYLRIAQLLGEDISGQRFDINYALKMSKNYESEYFV